MTEMNILGLTLANEWEHTINMVAESVREFTPDQWTQGITQFHTPARNAYHAVECIDYFFRNDPNESFEWGNYFDTGKIWGLADDELPNQKALLGYLEILRVRVNDTLTPLSAVDLSTPWGDAPTRLQFIVYGLRHTMRHQGELNALSVYHGNEPDNWE